MRHNRSLTEAIYLDPSGAVASRAGSPKQAWRCAPSAASPATDAGDDDPSEPAPAKAGDASTHCWYGEGYADLVVTHAASHERDHLCVLLQAGRHQLKPARHS